MSDQSYVDKAKEAVQQAGQQAQVCLPLILSHSLLSFTV